MKVTFKNSISKHIIATRTIYMEIDHEPWKPVNLTKHRISSSVWTATEVVDRTMIFAYGSTYDECVNNLMTELSENFQFWKEFNEHFGYFAECA